uniref:Asparagine synthase, putative n=1 Tax=Theileria annulata TaxID=5874 RepID=A0A3B0MXN3_THEAN
MIENEYIEAEFRIKDEKFDISEIECKLSKFNETTLEYDSFINTPNVDLYSFNIENCKLSSSHNTLDLESDICNSCILALFGNFSPDQKTLKLCINDVNTVLNSLSHFTGSFSLIYVSLHTGHIYILKDNYGFKSLLVSFNIENKLITISNKALNTNVSCYELPPFITLVVGKNMKTYIKPKSDIFRLTEKKFSQNFITDDLVNKVINSIHKELINSVKSICKITRQKKCVSILFSGGLDSAVITAITLLHTQFSYYELINVCFNDSSDVSEFGVAPDRITSLLSYEELVNLFPNLDIRLVLIDVSSEEYARNESEIFALTYPNNTHMDLNIGASLYYAGTLRGKLLSKEFFKSNHWQQLKSNVSILKSINFKVTISKRNSVKSGSKCELDELVSESDSSIDLTQFLEELKKHCNDYVSVTSDVLMGTGADELFGGYGRHVSAKIYDQNSDSTIDHSFTQEIHKDILRLWKRNLGRDDRVLNFRNISALYPFLANNLVDCMLTLPFNPAVIVDFLDPPDWFKSLGIYKEVDLNLLLNSEFLTNSGGKSVSVYINKWILREIAYINGLRMCCNFKKRAIQFGTRSAKIFNKLHNMSNRHASNKGSNILHYYIYIVVYISI